MDNNNNEINNNNQNNDFIILNDQNEVKNTNQNYTVYEANSSNTNNGKENFDDYYVNFSSQSMTKEKKPKKASGKGKKVVGVLCGVLVCTLLGAGVGVGTTIYLSKNTELLGATNVKKVVYESPTFKSDNSTLSVVNAVNKVKPAVVTVSTKSVASNGVFSQQQEGVGSGFIIDKEGHILTNYHVIANSTQVKVTLSNNKEVNAKVVNYDQSQDLAVIKITDNVQLPGIAELGDSDSVQAGEEVIAIGSPLGKQFTGTVTKGIISAVNRSLSSNSSSTFLQTDAAINPGNSGGPLINSKGQVIGINTSKIASDSSSEGGNAVEGIGFSIPINTAKERITALSKPLLKMGITITNITSDLAKQYNVPVGVGVTEVQEFSPAAKAGIKVNDVIIKFGGKTVKTGEELNKLKGTYKNGDVVPIVVSRDNKEVTLKITLEESSN
ncbi:S1C family serine protease [Inconstantimicrobium mannanitabidum]|uniref:Type I deoxyribonuclease HsdR n=1 Tax=Inconstantimicrobium mannanitabidum TaxID=1604901 RepID=A0ACB5R7C0_9CLOT|nr:trypsin-like peptidase domain-containing protein [Clostridium sp. TW13]GKX64901.1 type I deoxyribonuclease HsdR [Clostridium sp. TW13]